MKKGKIIVVSAASGAGKTTLLSHVVERIPHVVYSISATTRPPREHEKHGVHYFFMSKETFERKIVENAFAEWQEVHGNYYGTPREFIDATVTSSKHIIMDIDVYGKKEFDRDYPEAVGIFVRPPSMDELEKRLRDRNTDAEEVIQTRLKNARDEMAFAEKQGKYEYVLINDYLQQARRDMMTIVTNIIAG
ncbi:MAG: guanylate kinase [Chitinivibrionales bacterium]|nr:guanylate kinase [Chitinivibrionales bacterium]